MIVPIYFDIRKEEDNIRLRMILESLSIPYYEAPNILDKELSDIECELESK